MNDFKIDFCGIGAAKSGTTWVARQLRSHPQACVGHRKELNFFMRTHPFDGVLQRTGVLEDNLNHVKGMEWYAQQYASCAPDQKKGELSTLYLADPESPKLLHDHNPDLRLILNLRNPVEAIYSAYYQLSENHSINETFEELMRRSPFMLDYYHYSVHLKRYLETFPEEQILTIYMDDIKRDSMEVYRQVCKHIGIDDVELETTGKRVNKSKMVRSRSIRNATLVVYRMLNATEATRRMREWLKRGGGLKVSRSIRKWNSVVEKYPPMSVDTQKWMIDVFHDDIIELGKMHNRDLSHWLQIKEPEGVEAR